MHTLHEQRLVDVLEWGARTLRRQPGRAEDVARELALAAAEVRRAADTEREAGPCEPSRSRRLG
jgi:hypothetical protein